MNVADLPLPVVLKPSVGFCSMGVYVIEEPEDWAAAVADIARREDGWHERYPESVVGSSEYLIEGYLAGTEYALDAYFDEGGTPHILNILRHDFAGRRILPIACTSPTVPSWTPGTTASRRGWRP